MDTERMGAALIGIVTAMRREAPVRNRIEWNGADVETYRTVGNSNKNQTNQMTNTNPFSALMQSMNVKIEFIEPILGCSPGNPEILDEFVASKVADDRSGTDKSGNKAEEVATALDMEEEVTKVSTVFPKDEQGLFIWDYQWRGFLKASLATMIELGLAPKEMNRYNFRKIVDTTVFVKQRRVYFHNKEGNFIEKTDETLQRPLRAQTMKGERIALARSQMLPAGTRCEFDINWMKASGSGNRKTIACITEDILVGALHYGELHGWGQWRGGSYGRFKFEASMAPEKK